MIKRIYRKLKGSFYGRPINPFHDYPFGRKPKADRATYIDIWESAKKQVYPIIDRFEKYNQLTLDRYWFDELALHTQIVIKDSEICYQHGRLLYVALSNYLQKNNCNSVNILETGTARGFSSLCMAKALQDQDREGKIISLDPLPHNVKMYWNCVDDFEGEKTRAELLSNYYDLVKRYIWFIEGRSESILKLIEISRIHFAFLDGSHNYEDVKIEITYVTKRQKKGGIIFFDDYQEILFPGIVKAVKELKSEGSYDVKTIKANEQRGYAIATKII